MRILVTDGMDKTAMAQLREAGHEVVEQFYEPAELGKALRDFDVVVVRSKTKVRAAGLDVYADEPATNKALYSHPMVSCTPHIGSATVEAQGRIGEELVEIISKM